MTKQTLMVRGCAMLLMVLFLAAMLPMKSEARKFTLEANPYDFLSVPTQLTKLGEDWFLVDCYHNQILTSKSVSQPVKNWKVMANGFDGPHAIAWDGEVYMAVDTEHNRIITYKKTWEGFEELQIIPNVGVRPHHVQYDWERGCFMVWSSMSGEMYYFVKTPGTKEVELVGVQQVPELMGHYVRSFTTDGEFIYLPCADVGAIWVVDRENFKTLQIIQVPQEIAGIVNIAHLGAHYYISVSTDILFDTSKATLVRVNQLSDLAAGTYENLKSLIGEGGPYYFSNVDGVWYAPVPRENKKSAGIRFQEDAAGSIVNFKEISYRYE